MGDPMISRGTQKYSTVRQPPLVIWFVLITSLSWLHVPNQEQSFHAHRLSTDSPPRATANDRTRTPDPFVFPWSSLPHLSGCEPNPIVRSGNLVD